jgi:hypothetical protein
MISLEAFVIFAFFLLTSATSTDPRNFTGFAELETCAKEGLVGCAILNQTCTQPDLRQQLGCSNWICVCDNFASAVNTASADVASLCTSNSVQVNSATSLLTGFCEQLVATAVVSGVSSSGRPFFFLSEKG